MRNRRGHGRSRALWYGHRAKVTTQLYWGGGRGENRGGRSRGFRGGGRRGGRRRSYAGGRGAGRANLIQNFYYNYY